MNIILHNKRATAIILFLNLLLLGTYTKAQAPTSQSQSVIDKTSSYNENLPGERLYLHFDKPYYAIGDTVWFKGYILNSTLLYSTLSSRVYIDLINDSNRVVQRFIFPVSIGLTVGNIYLDEKLVHEGAYTIRAYTHWMRNFSPDQFFYKNFYVAKPGEKSFLVKTKSSLSKNHVNVNLAFTTLNNQAAEVKDMQVSVMNDKKTLHSNNSLTSANGNLNLDFDLPENTAVKNLTLIARDGKSNNTEKIPVNITRPLDVDIQFMPESGPLVELLPAHIGFKAIGENGKGVDIKGVLIDKEKNEEVDFESFHNGMGVFDFVPQPDEIYTAKITLPNGEFKMVNLPAIKKSGTLLKIKNGHADSLEITVFATKDMQSPTDDYTIIGQSRGTVCYAATFKLKKDYAKFYVPENLFPTGVAHFTLFNSRNEPLNDRLSFINHNDNLKIDINAGQATYTSRDSIPLHIIVKDDKGNPVAGSFSLSVTDDQQVKTTDLNKENIFTSLLLSSELKGYVENPAYYFNAGTDAAKALDMLLLTQGWKGYSWKEILNAPARPAFAAEPSYMIKGKVVNLLNKPIANSNVTLLSTGKVKIFKDTVTDAGGQFTFKNFPVITDSTAFVLEARKAKGRVINAGISVEDDKSVPKVALPYFPQPIPWYVNGDSTILNYVKTSAAYHDDVERLKYGPDTHLLKTVDIRDKVIIKGSKNLNGAGNYDQAITQDEIEKAGKISLLKLIEQKVKGFHEGYGRKAGNISFMLREKQLRFSIDGIDLDRFYEPSDNGLPDEHYVYQKQILDYFSAEDVTGIEVIYSSRYNALYKDRNLLSTDELVAAAATAHAGQDIAYLEITTRSGQGPFANRANGIFVYRPAPVTIPAQFYEPKYPVKNMYPGFTDRRSIIHWEPNIVTNKKGEARTVFYAADQPTTYTIVLQGANLNGKVGYTIKKLTIYK
jgi:hypothetical protein